MMKLVLFGLLFLALAFGHEEGVDPAPEAHLPGVEDLTPSNFASFVDGSKAALVEFYAPWCGHCKHLAPEYGKLGELVSKSSYKNDLVIAKVNADAHHDLGSKFGVTGFPTIKFFPKGGNTDKPEEYDGDRSLDGFIKFLNDKAGVRLTKPVVIGPVTVLDAGNFNSIVMDSGKDVLVEFYAPWCGHCKRLAPEYDKLGLAFKNEKDVVIAKMDAADSVNSPVASKYGVSGYPTLKWFPKENKDGVDCDAPRDAEGLIEWVNKKAGTFRLIGGLLNAQAGRVKALDAIVKGFAGDIEGKTAALKAKVGDDVDEDEKLYLATAEKVAAKGAEYLTKESERLQKMIKGQSVSADKLDMFVKKFNVLSAFNE